MISAGVLHLRACSGARGLSNLLKPSICTSRKAAILVMNHILSPAIRPGIINVPGRTPESQKLVEDILAQDRANHHCLYGPNAVFHNHLSHHILAAYDLGAPTKLLQAIRDADNNSGLRPIDIVNKSELESMTEKNWTSFLGQDKYYSAYLTLFSSEIAAKGAGETLEKYIFSPAANGNGSDMIARLVGGAFHPLIQVGYAVEFGSDAMLAQALAQAAVHTAFIPELFDFQPAGNTTTPLSLLEIFRQVYDSSILKPVMPYDPEAFLSARVRDVQRNGRAEEVKRLSALWLPADELEADVQLETKVEELFWLTTLLLAGTGKPGRKPRLDFFLMHLLNVSIFLPSLLKLISTRRSKVALIKAMLPVTIMFTLLRGRPRIDPKLIMSYTATPSPPKASDLLSKLKPDASTIGDPNDPAFVNPWPVIIASVLHAHDPHTLKAIRALYYAGQQYGHTAAGNVVGAFQSESSEETHEGIGKLDGTVFIRAAGVVMETLGWASYGQEAGDWDRSALGWDDAWKGGD